jgi:hypothetical protein
MPVFLDFVCPKWFLKPMFFPEYKSTAPTLKLVTQLLYRLLQVIYEEVFILEIRQS